MSSWINIDRLGTKGIEPDMMPPHREPSSLDAAVNVRALGANIANAGGYRLVANGSLPQETIPSVCACPDQHLERTQGDGETHIDRSFTWDWDLPLQNRFNAVMAFQAASSLGGEFDQTLIYRRGECEANRQNRAEIRILNTSAARRVQMETYDAAGVSQGLSLDYDATTEFTDGADHWVFVNHQNAGSPYEYSIFLDATDLGTHLWSPQYSTDYITVVRANSPANLLLPVSLWTYGPTIWDCLRAGNFNGFGRCVFTGAQNPIRYDLARSSAELNYYRGNAAAVAKLGNPLGRNAYSNVLPVTGKVYWESEAGDYDSPLCRNSNVLGGCDRSLDLAGNRPGRVAQTFGIQAVDGAIWINNVEVAPSGSPFIFWARAVFAFDPATKEVWIGADQSGNRVWMPGDPETTPGYVTTIDNLQPVSHFENQNDAARVISGSGTKFPAPAGFTELIPA